MKLLKDLDVKDKRIFLRADLDVPIEPETIHNKQSFSTNKLESDTATRLSNLKGTVDYLIKNGAKQVVIAGHIDRPTPRLRDGKPVIDPSKSTKLLLEVLQKILGKEITFIPNVILVNEVRPESDSGQAGMTSSIVLLENLRFWEGETENDEEFARKLAAFGDVYVNEAFGNSHREHASMVALPSLLPHCAGLHLEKEVTQMNKLLMMPVRPFIAIVGGAKIDTKISVIENLSRLAHFVLVGGELPVEIKKQGIKFPENVLVAQLEEDNKDVSQGSTDLFCRHLVGARTIVWNGPMGLFEEGFTRSTLQLAGAIVQSGAYSVVGGGETTQFLEKHNLLFRFSFVSAGGGAMLEFLAGKELPGIKALE